MTKQNVGAKEVYWQWNINCLKKGKDYKVVTLFISFLSLSVENK